MRNITFLILLVFITACQKQATTTDAAVASSILNVSYGADPQQKLDVYLPAGRSADSTRLVFLIHGGGWTGGDKADFTGSISSFQLSLPGYAFVNINYRLAANGQNLFPVQENDVKTAVDFVYNKRNDYKVSDKWVFLGASAGGHLAMLQAYKYSSPVKAKAVVDFFGPSDLTGLYNSNILTGFQLALIMGGTPVTNPAIYQQSSPINFITAQSPATIILQGGADPLVPPIQSSSVRDKLQSLGVVNQYVFYPNNGHGWEGADLTDSFEKLTAFIKQNVH